jgi:WD40 repeat protein
VNSAAFSPDGSRIVTGSADKTARIWDTASAKEIAVLRGHDTWVNFAAFSPTGRALLQRQMTRPPASGTPISRQWT